MGEFLQDHYLAIKALHIISVISWMAGMLYLPRLYVYHAGVAVGSEASELLKVMERRLLRYITNPAMIATFLTGGMLFMIPNLAVGGWFHMKFTLILLLAGVHGMFSRWRKDFEKDKNTKSQKFFRIANEVPTVIMIIVVVLVVVKPF